MLGALVSFVPLESELQNNECNDLCTLSMGRIDGEGEEKRKGYTGTFSNVTKILSDYAQNYKYSKAHLPIVNHAQHQPMDIVNHQQPSPTSTMSTVNHARRQPCPSPIMPNVNHAHRQPCPSSTLPIVNHAQSQPCPTSTMPTVNHAHRQPWPPSTMPIVNHAIQHAMLHM